MLILQCSFALLESYLEEQAAVAFASSHTVSGKTNAASTETATKPGLKRKGSGQGSRGVEVSPSRLYGSHAVLTTSSAETEKGQYVKDAEVDELLYEEAKGVDGAGTDQRSCSLDGGHYVVVGFNVRICMRSCQLADSRKVLS